MNAALQALVHILPLKQYFLRTYFRRLRTQVEVGADALFDNLIHAMWSPVPRLDRDLIDPYGLSTDCVSPVITKSLVSFMWKRFPFLHPGEQHDAQEFLRCFLNELHDSLKIIDQRVAAGSLIEADGHHYQHRNNRHDNQHDDSVERDHHTNQSNLTKVRYLAEEFLGKLLVSYNY